MKGLGNGSHRTARILVAIAALSAFLHLFGIWREGTVNPYYAATVQSMLLSWKNFFFASLDPTGFVSVDKPPLALWIQAALARVFGLRDWVLILPQALAGVGCVLLMFRLVGRRFGDAAGLWASLFLALTPIIPATSRNNTMDVLLLLFVLFAVERFFRALESGRTRDLALCAFFLGLGFNVKMVQAFIALPAGFVTWILFAPKAAWNVRAGRALTFAAVLTATSLAWVLAVDLTPEDRRPFVGSSQTNSAMDLAVGYNLKDRLHRDHFRLRRRPLKTPSGAPVLRMPSWMRSRSAGSGEFGPPGPFRVLNRPVGPQVSWFILLAVLGAWAGFSRRAEGTREGPAKAEVLFWSLWAATGVLLFDFGRGILHRQYLVMLAPPLSALAAIGVDRGLEGWRTRGAGWRRWALPLFLASTAVIQAVFTWRSFAWGKWMALAAVSAFAGVVVLAVLRPRPGSRESRVGILGVLGLLLLSPLAWSLTPLFHDGQVRFPRAGPELTRSGRIGPGSTMPRERRQKEDLYEYLRANAGGEEYLVAVPEAENMGSEFLLALKRPILVFGGFAGRDPILTVDGFRSLVDEGRVRHVVLMAEDLFKIRRQEKDPADHVNRNLLRWVVENGEEVRFSEAKWRLRLLRLESPKDRGGFSGPRGLSGSSNP